MGKIKGMNPRWEEQVRAQMAEEGKRRSVRQIGPQEKGAASDAKISDSFEKSSMASATCARLQVPDRGERQGVETESGLREGVGHVGNSL